MDDEGDGGGAKTKDFSPFVKTGIHLFP